MSDQEKISKDKNKEKDQWTDYNMHAITETKHCFVTAEQSI